MTDILQHTSGTFEFKSSGLGLGLSAVRAILHAHGTAVDVETMPGQGSCFSFSLLPAEKKAREERAAG